MAHPRNPRSGRIGASIALLLVAACTTAPTNGLDRLDAAIEPDAAAAAPDASPAADAESSLDAEPPSDARVGPRIFRGRAEDGFSRAADLTRWQFNASQDGRVVASSPGRADGTFELEVPEGEIRIDMMDPTRGRPLTTSVVTDLDSVDFIAYRGISRTRAGTTLSIDGSLASPWNPADELHVIGSKLQSAYAPPAHLSAGHLGFGPIVFDWSSQPQHRGQPDDDLFVVRRTSTSAADGPRESVISELAKLEDLSIADRAQTSLSGVRLLALPMSEPVELRYRGPDAMLFHPRMRLFRSIDARSGRTNLSVRKYESYADAASVVRRIPEVPGSDATTFFLWAYAPAHVSADRSFYIATVARKKVQVARPSGVVDMTPALGPPIALRVAGRLTHAGEMAGVGLAPLLEWESPRAGHCDGYLVQFFDLTIPGYMASRGEAWTTRTSFTIPSDWMTPGHRYYVLVSAFDRGGESVVRRITLDALEQVAVLSEPFSP